MKRLALTALALLLMRDVAADAAFDKRAAEDRRLNKAYAEVMASCAPIERRLAIEPDYETRTPRELIITRSEWTGGCQGDLVDGDGSVTMLTRTSNGTRFGGFPQYRQQSGLMIKGEQVGPWLNHTHEMPHFGNGPAKQSWVVGLYSWTDTIYPGFYQRSANGDMVAVTYGYAPGEKISPGVTEPGIRPLAGVPVISAAAVTQHRQARLGQPGAIPPKIPVPMLADLLPGGAVAYAPESPASSVREQSAVLLLSTRTPRSFRNIDDMRKQLETFAEREQAPKRRHELKRMAMAVDGPTLLGDVAVVLRKSFKSVTVAPDLRTFLAGEADYAVVLDVDFEHDAPRFFRLYDAVLGGQAVDTLENSADITRGGISMVVFDRRFQVRRSLMSTGNLSSSVWLFSRNAVGSALEATADSWGNRFGTANAPGHGIMSSILKAALSNREPD